MRERESKESASPASDQQRLIDQVIADKNRRDRAREEANAALEDLRGSVQLALKGGVTGPMLAAATGLSKQRLSQLRRGVNL